MVSDQNFTAVDHEAKALEYEERARRAIHPEVAQGWRMIAEAHRMLARIEEGRGRDTLPSVH